MKIENIKFKAKSFVSHNWVEGDLIHKNGRTYIKRDKVNLANVDPSTVCQFTGLKDCEGKEVWEGDILLNVANDGPDGIVVFKYGAFSLLAKNGRDYCIALTYLLSVKDSLNRFKVIGNKFDRKEGEK